MCELRGILSIDVRNVLIVLSGMLSDWSRYAAAREILTAIPFLNLTRGGCPHIFDENPRVTLEFEGLLIATIAMGGPYRPLHPTIGLPRLGQEDL